MTYRELIETLKSMTDDMMDDDVMVYIPSMDEFFPLVDDRPVDYSEEDKVLDAYHLYLSIDA